MVETFLGLLFGLCVSYFAGLTRDLYDLCRGFSPSFFLHSHGLSNKLAFLWPCLDLGGFLYTCTFAIGLWRTVSKVGIYMFHMGALATALPPIAVAKPVVSGTVWPSILYLSLGDLDVDTEWEECSLDPCCSLGCSTFVGICAFEGNFHGILRKLLSNKNSTLFKDYHHKIWILIA